jgi:hypothetical protein
VSSFKLKYTEYKEIGTVKGKPNLTVNQRQNGQIMEPDANGGMGNCPKPDSGHHHYSEKADEKGLSIYTRSLPENFPTV